MGDSLSYHASDEISYREKLKQAGKKKSRKGKPAAKYQHRWRANWDYAGQRREANESHGAGVLDEVVIDQWFHVERMDERQFWLRVGEAEFDISIDRLGNATVTPRWEAKKVTMPTEKERLASARG